MSHGLENPKMDSPHIKSSCGTHFRISNPMGIGSGIDYVTWRKILKWIPPTSNPDVGHNLGFSNPMGIGSGILTLSHGGNS